jgi:hypothetical protein
MSGGRRDPQQEVSEPMKAQPTDPRGTKGAPVRSYSTRFTADETPISEGGLWINGLADGIDWADVVVEGGVAHGGKTRMAVAERRAEQAIAGATIAAGEMPEGDYDDPTALLAGRWGRNQHAKGRVFSRNQTEEYFQEVELRLRSSLGPHSCTGYEVFWRCLKTGAAYAEIVRWNEKIRDFTSLARKQGPDCGVKDGDLVEATITGNVIRSFINGVEVLSAVDDVYTEGNPGIGFNFGCGNSYVDHGFSAYEVETFDD